MRPDDREDDVGRLHALDRVVPPLDPRADVQRVEEDVLGPEALLQRLGELTRSRLSVEASIADEDSQDAYFAAGTQA